MATLREKKKQLEDNLKKAQQAISELQDKEAKRIGKVAIKAGLADVEITEEKLLEAFKELAARFHKKP